MVGTLVKLQLKLFGRGVRGSVGKIIALVVGALYLLGAFAAIAAGLYFLRGQSLGLRGGATAAGFAVLTAGWPMITLLVAGADQTLDPGRFALLPVRARQLMPGLLVVGLVGLGGIFTVACAVMYLYSWTASWTTALAALVGAVLGTLTCVLLARALAAVFSQALSSRRYRDMAALVLGVFAMTIGLGIQAASRWAGESGFGADQLAGLGRVAAWTPFGWAWALPWDLGRGDTLALVAHLVLALALVGGLWRVWEHHLDKALVSPLESSGGGGQVKASSFVDRLVPPTPAGAVAARSLRYWRRDPRHLIQLVAATLMPVLLAAPVLMNSDDAFGGGGASLLAYPVMASVIIAGMVVATEISYDGSALWMHISAGLTGRADRLGRLMALGWLFVPITVVVDLVFLGLSGQWQHTPALLGTSLGSLLAGAAVGTVSGAQWQTPQPPPGQNAFGRSSGGGLVAVLSSLISMFCSGLLCLPLIVPAMLSADRPWLGWLLLVVGPLYGAALLWGAVVWGGRLLERRWPEVLKAVTFESS